MFEYRSDRPEVRQEFSVLYTARPVAGEAEATPEAQQVAWIDDNELDQLDITATTRRRINAWHTHRASGTLYLG